MQHTSLMSTMMKGEKGSIQAITGVEPFCDDCYLLQSKTYMEYANGTEASAATGVYDHHAVYFNPRGHSQMMVCKGASAFLKGPKILGGAAIDGSYQLYTTPDGKFKSGNYIPSRAKVMAMTEFVNYKPDAQEIYLVTEYEAVPGPRDDYMDAAKLPLSAATCAKAQWVLKDAVDIKKSGTYVVPQDAYVLSVGEISFPSFPAISSVNSQSRKKANQRTNRWPHARWRRQSHPKPE
jgi:hypothetical protein